MKCALLVAVLAASVSVLVPEPAGALNDSWYADESIAFADARDSGRHIVIVFGADWCAPCRKIDEIINGDIVFGLLSKSFVPLHFDITDLTDSDEALQAKYHVPALPAVIFVDAAGQELGRWGKNLSARGLIAAIQAALAVNPLASGVSQ